MVNSCSFILLCLFYYIYIFKQVFLYLLYKNILSNNLQLFYFSYRKISNCSSRLHIIVAIYIMIKRAKYCHIDTWRRKRLYNTRRDIEKYAVGI